MAHFPERANKYYAGLHSANIERSPLAQVNGLPWFLPKEKLSLYGLEPRAGGGVLSSQVTSELYMNDESSFLLEVSGRPIDESAIERLSRIIQRYLEKADPEVKLAQINFARIFYKLSWSGSPGDMYYLTLAHKRILSDAGKYFEKWEYKIKINIIDRGKET